MNSFKEKLNKIEFILGSESPRRKQLLTEMGLSFKVISSNTDETHCSNLNSKEIVEHLAVKKANSFDKKLMNENTILITADTLVDLDGQIISKPKDLAQAIEFLSKLSGKMHTVLTGVCLTSKHKQVCFTDKTQVYFSQLTEEEVTDYVNKMQPLDKAGAYAVQEWIGYIGIERIEGSFHNVVGLPTAKLWQELKCFVDSEFCFRNY